MLVLAIPYTGSLPLGSDPVNYARPKIACLIDPLLSHNKIMSEHLFEEIAEDDSDIVNDNVSDGKEKKERKPKKLEY